MDKLPELNSLIHSRVRLGIVSILSTVEEATFLYLKEKLGVTDGNLSVNISKLEDAGYLEVIKTFKGKKPLTMVRLTQKGRQAFVEYVELLESHYLKGKH